MKRSNVSIFLLRLLASLVDLTIIIVIHSIFLFSISGLPSLQAATNGIGLYLIFVVCNPLLYFYPVFFVHWVGGSAGKLITGLRVVHQDGSLLSLKRAFFRQTVGYQFSGTLFGLGFLAILRDTEARAWHDKITSSRVTIKQNSWPIALLFLFATLTGSCFLFAQAVGNVVRGPIGAEATQLYQQLQQKEKAKPEQDQGQKPFPLPPGKPQPQEFI